MLDKLMVLELANVLAGPSVGMFFAELGARVVKVENLHSQGDVTRKWKNAHEPQDERLSAYFCSVNWGKESLALDLKQAKGQAIVHQLAKQASVVISSYLPGQAEKLSVDSPTLLTLNPQLICAEVSGYGPELQRPAYDAIIQAETGFMSLNGVQGQALKMPVALMDVLAAHQLKEAILLALLRRSHTGKGDIVRVSLWESGVVSLVNQANNYLATGQVPQPIGSHHPNIVPYGTPFYTVDAKALVLAVGSDLQYASLRKILQLPPKPAYRRNVDRVQHREAVNAELAAAIQVWHRDELLHALKLGKVPAGAVCDLAEVFDQDRAQALTLEQEGRVGIRSFVATGDWGPQPYLKPPPLLGEDADSILQELGYTRASREQLRADKVIS